MSARQMIRDDTMRRAAQEADDLASAVNNLNDKRTRRASAAADFIAIFIIGVLAGLVVVHFLTPCATGALC